MSWRCQYPRPPGITIRTRADAQGARPEAGRLATGSELGLSGSSLARRLEAGLGSATDSESPRPGEQRARSTGMMAVFGFCRRHGSSGTGAVLVLAAGILRSLPARLGSWPAVAPKPPQPLSRALTGRALAGVSGSFLDTVCSLQLGRRGNGKRAPARGGDVRRCRAAAGDVVRPPHAAPCGQCSIKRPGCVWCSCCWEQGPSSRSKTGTALDSRVDDLQHAVGGQLLLCSTAARHTHWASLIVDSGPYP